MGRGVQGAKQIKCATFKLHKHECTIEFTIVMWIHDVQWRGSVPYGETLHDKYYLF